MKDVIVQLNTETNVVEIFEIGGDIKENFKIELGSPNESCIKWAVMNCSKKKQLLKVLERANTKTG